MTAARPSMSRTRAATWLAPVCLCAVIVAVPLIPLFDLNRVFYLDWINHLWSIEYFGAFLRSNGFAPTEMNTQEVVGSPLPLFYAGKFYTALGGVAAVVGAGLAVRLAVASILVLQYFCITRVLGGPRAPLAIAVAAIVTWATYPLTNLYNRSALTEFFAVCLLTCSVACFLSIILRSAKGERASQFDMMATGLFYAAAAVTHPITALFGALLLGILGLLAIVFSTTKQRRFLLMFGAANVVAIGAVLSPWVYLNWLFRGQLIISDPTANAESFRRLGFLPDGFDNFWSRLSPVPLDLRSVKGGIRDISTPYLDAQIALPLLILILALAFAAYSSRTEKRPAGFSPTPLFATSIGLAVFFFAVSVAPVISSWLGGLFDIMQFPYRVVTYVNLSLLCAVVIGAQGFLPAQSRPRTVELGIAFALGLALASAPLKLVHAEAISNHAIDDVSYPAARPTVTPLGGDDSKQAWRPRSLTPGQHADHMPVTFYGNGAYSAASGFQFGPQPGGPLPTLYSAFRVNAKGRFGWPEPQRVDVATQTLFVTNVQVFPWNRLIVDGAILPENDLIVVQLYDAAKTHVGSGLGMVIDPGAHRVETRFIPDQGWRALDRLSWATLTVWAAALCAVGLLRARQLRRTSSR